MLEAIGLSAVESTLYVTLVDNPRSSASELARHAEVPPGVAGRALGQFVRRGLASRLPGRHPRYVAVAPDLSIQPLLNRREDELHQVRTALHDLMTAFHRASRHTHPAELVEVVTGARNITSRAFALQESAQSQLRGIDKAPYVMEGLAPNHDRENERLRDGIEYRVLYDRDALLERGRLEDVRGSVARGEKARVMPDAPLKLWIVDDSAALIPIRTAGQRLDAAFVVYPSALLDALIALFELEWERATPIRFPARPPSSPEPLDRDVLALLAAGHTDEGIARALGLSLRTVQRRISALMATLRSSTRFQAGMAARERGWV